MLRIGLTADCDYVRTKQRYWTLLCSTVPWTHSYEPDDPSSRGRGHTSLLAQRGGNNNGCPSAGPRCSSRGWPHG